MPSYWRVSPKFWTDPAVRRCSDDAKLLAMYLLTGPHRRLEGLFRLPKPYICADLGWTMEQLDKPFRELLGERFGEPGFMAYDEQAEVVLIRNALKYQAPENDNQVKAAIKQLEDVPDTPLTCEFRRLAIRYSERLAKRLPQGFGEPIPDPPAPAPAPAPKNNTVVEQARPIDDTTAVFQTWQDAARKPRARLDEKRRRLIRAALKHYPLADVLDAVQGWQHSPHHRGENEQRTVYNDLGLLLRDSAHIENFRDLWRDGPAQVIGKQTAKAMEISRQMRQHGPGEVRGNDHDLGGMVGHRGRPERALPAPGDRAADLP